MVTNGDEVSLSGVEANLLGLSELKRHRHELIVLDDFHWLLFALNEVIDIDDARVGNTGKNRWSEWRPLDAVEVLSKVGLEAADWSLVLSIVKSNLAVSGAGDEQSLVKG